MFFNFLDELRSAGIPASMKERDVMLLERLAYMARRQGVIDFMDISVYEQ